MNKSRSEKILYIHVHTHTRYLYQNGRCETGGVVIPAVRNLYFKYYYS